MFHASVSKRLNFTKYKLRQICVFKTTNTCSMSINQTNFFHENKAFIGCHVFKHSSEVWKCRFRYVSEKLQNEVS